MLFSKPVRPEPLVKPKRQMEIFDDGDGLSAPAQEEPAGV
jgi:CPA2 family monovalent cation:H+ antiporter-2